MTWGRPRDHRGAAERKREARMRGGAWRVSGVVCLYFTDIYGMLRLRPHRWLNNTHQMWAHPSAPTWLGQGCNNLAPCPLPVLQLRMPDIFIVQRHRSYEEELGSALNLCLNHIKTALCNFLNDLTRAVPTETDHAPCPNIEPCPPNGRESKHVSFSPSRNIGTVLLN